MTQNEYLKMERLGIELNSNPFFKSFDPIPSKLTPSHWAVALADYPKLVEDCPCFDGFDRYDWARLLGRQPQFADRCACWNEFEPDTWRRLLTRQPQFLSYCEKKNDPEILCGLLASGSVAVEEIDTTAFTFSHWFWAVKHHWLALRICPCREKFTKEMWWSILIDSPQLASHCPCLKEFNLPDWELLVTKNPELLRVCLRCFSLPDNHRGMFDFL